MRIQRFLGVLVWLGIGLSLVLPAVGTDLEGVRIVAWTGYVGEREWGNLRATLEGAGATVLETTTLDPSEFLELLEADDVLLLPEQAVAGWGIGELDRVGAELAVALRGHLSRGGRIVALTYAAGGEDILRMAGLTTAEDDRDVTGEALLVVAAAESLVEGVAQEFIAPPMTTDFTSVDGDAEIIVATVDGAPVVFRLQREGGEITVLGFDFYADVQTASETLAINACRAAPWALRPSLENDAPSGAVVVDGDQGFDSVPGITGAGTAEDPYVISGEFNANGESFGLYIRCTTRHFAIQDAVFRGARDAGLWLENVQNGWVVSSVFEDNAVGALIEGGGGDVAFTLNTFRGNGTHAVDSSSRAAWDDGRVGNWWQGYTGSDENGNGIGSVARDVESSGDPDGTKADRFPLVEPLAGMHPPEGAVLLQVSYSVGESFLRAVELETEMTVDIMGMRIPMVVHSTMLVESDVIRQHGAGSYTYSRHTVLEDVGSVTAMGMPDEYSSDVGMVYVTRDHRFGDYDEVEGEVIARGGMPGMARPARWIAVGDSWIHTVEADAEALGLPDGSATFSGVGLFDRLEERGGRTLAVLVTAGDYTAEAFEEDAVLGRIDYTLYGTFSFTEYVDVETGRPIEEMAAVTLDGDVEADGEKIGRIQMSVSTVVRDHGPEQRAERAPVLTAVDRERGLVVISLGTDHAVSPGEWFEVYHIVRMADGTEIEEQRGWIVVQEVVSPDRTVCRIEEEHFPFQVGDPVRRVGALPVGRSSASS